MKKLKQIVTDINNVHLQGANADKLIRSFIFYSPKMPLRLHQEQLLEEAKKFNLKVYDTYFTQTDLTINCFSWGNGKNKVLLTHGWASKAADFFELITELKKIDDLEIIAFDAPGNGSSVSEFSNLMLYAKSVEALTKDYALPDFIIGHSLGGMANVLAIQEIGIKPRLLISIAPLIRLKENFEQSLNSINIEESIQQTFFHNFNNEFPVPADYFNLVDLYKADQHPNHFLAFDPDDHISPYDYLKDFLSVNPAVQPKAYENIGHYKILRSPELIGDIAEQIKSIIS
ncbi:alpha/beta fold hydrolase [Pedobacter punctiformis]|uniref:Alpha/beta hydrolase n=1 Tax=Pedobacter punctiformis TaxID=3004097 RepID=A0ABT4L9K2_9SPHI|nr:alpha/beta hydrolase [Pedobacter sp. HCMS5-2]MCZ4244603.1 alpha/beta hydrolase [Pedobacter sp. HCMS5-2]